MGFSLAMGGNALIVAGHNRGTAWKDKGDPVRAIADFTEAIRIDPKFAYAYYNRGIAKRHKGDQLGGDADIALGRLIAPNVGK